VFLILAFVWIYFLVHLFIPVDLAWISDIAFKLDSTFFLFFFIIFRFVYWRETWLTTGIHMDCFTGRAAKRKPSLNLFFEIETIVLILVLPARPSNNENTGQNFRDYSLFDNEGNKNVLDPFFLVYFSSFASLFPSLLISLSSATHISFFPLLFLFLFTSLLSLQCFFRFSLCFATDIYLSFATHISFFHYWYLFLFSRFFLSRLLLSEILNRLTEL